MTKIIGFNGETVSPSQVLQNPARKHVFFSPRLDIMVEFANHQDDNRYDNLFLENHERKNTILPVLKMW